MALIVKIQVNNEVLFVASAVRISRDTNPPTLNKYEIASYDYRKDEDGEYKKQGHIYHHYGDRAEVLAKKMLALIEWNNYVEKRALK